MIKIILFTIETMTDDTTDIYKASTIFFMKNCDEWDMRETNITLYLFNLSVYNWFSITKFNRFFHNFELLENP